MCGGYSCSKTTLMIINVCYMIVSFILIGVAVKERVTDVIVSVPVIGGITACGIFLLAISLWGIVAALKHHQVMLFVYMCILFLIFIIQFSVSCAALGFSQESEKKLIEGAWDLTLKNGDNKTIFEVEKTLDCCGLNDDSTGINCAELTCYPKCNPCMAVIEDKLDSAFNTVGGLGLFFALTELIGGVVACRYRNLVDPANSGISGMGPGAM